MILPIHVFRVDSGCDFFDFADLGSDLAGEFAVSLFWAWLVILLASMIWARFGLRSCRFR